MTNNTSLKSIAFSIALAMICFSLGCDQQRYSSSEWAPATSGNGTLPGVGMLGDGSGSADVSTTSNSLPSRSETLPSRRSVGTSLPWRAGNGTSLPYRAGGTLPGRQQMAVVRRPKKKEKPPIPTLPNTPLYDTDEKPKMPRVRGKLGLYMGDTKGIIRLPVTKFQRNSGSTLPGRNGTTLPARARNANWSTLPGRE